jgi:hypothetical protein
MNDFLLMMVSLIFLFCFVSALFFILGILEFDSNVKNPPEKVKEAWRRFVSIILPFVILGFILFFTDSQNDSTNIKEFMASISWIIRFIVGIAVGIGIIEFLKHRPVARIKKIDISIIIFLLLFSSLCAFLVFLLLKGALGSLDFFLFGFYLASGLWIIFR